MDKRKIGALQVVLAAFSWSFSGVFCKWIPWSSITIIGLRGLVTAFILGMTRRSFRVRITRGTLLGALGACLNCILVMMATKLTTSANAIVLQYAMPVFVILMCWIFYKQRPSAVDAITAACVLAGVALCSWEGLISGGGQRLGDLLALLSGVAYALVYFCARMPDTNASDYVYLGCVFCIPLSGYAFFDPKMTLEPMHLLAICGMGLSLAGGYFFISKSLNNVHPVTSALLANLEPVLNPIWVFLFLGENPSDYTKIGAAVVIVSVSIYSVINIRRK